MHTDMIMAATNIVKVTTPAGKVQDLVLIDNCHFGNNMREVIELLEELGCVVNGHGVGLPNRGQGFINQRGQNFNRSEAYVIAKESGQAFNDQYTLPNNKLDSSCIRHFKYKLDALVYHKE